MSKISLTTILIFILIFSGLMVADAAAADLELSSVEMVKTYDAKEKTVTLAAPDTKTLSTESKLEIKLISAEPDLCTFTEVFEVYAHSDWIQDTSTDFVTSARLESGNHTITGVDWYRWDGKEFAPFDPAKSLITQKAGTKQRYKLIWHKKAETGPVSIETAPKFLGVECKELTWWNANWERKKEVTITNPSAVQALATVLYEDEMQADYGDLRFVDETETVELDYWIESSDGTDAEVWIELVDTDSTIYMYYGNSDAEDASDGDATFEFFDDFEGDSVDTDKWITATADTIDVSNSICTLAVVSGNNEDIITSIDHFGVNNIIGARLKSGHFGSSSYYERLYCDEYYVMWSFSSVNTDYTGKFSTTGGTPEMSDIMGWDADTYYTTETMRNGATSVIFAINGVVKSTHTTSIPTNSDYIRFYARYAGASVSVDWVYVRKYAATEPEFSFGEEETSCRAAFSGSPTTGSNPLSVAFTDASTGDITSYLWEFGDGWGSIAQNPTHTYTEAGTYTVSLTVSDGVNTDQEAKSNYITVANTMGISGYCYDLETGSPLSNVNVSYTQSGDTQYATSNAAGYYNIGGITTGAGISVDATLANYTHTSWSFVPETTAMDDINLYLTPSNFSTFSGPALCGQVYETDYHQAVNGATVTIQNSSWSSSYTSTSTGFYVFTNITAGNYFVSATKTGYDDSDQYAASIIAGNITTKNILISETSMAGTLECVPHNVRFKVITIWGEPITDCNVTASYVESSGPLDWLWEWLGISSGVGITTNTLSGQTDSNGEINFLMVETIKYSINFQKTGSINLTKTYYPKEERYIVIATGTGDSDWWGDGGYNVNEQIDVGVYKDDDHGYLNISYIDYLSETSAVTIYINQSNRTAGAAETVIDTTVINNDSEFWYNTTLADYGGESYLIHLEIDHTTFGEVFKDFSVSFSEFVDPFSLSDFFGNDIAHRAYLLFSFFIMLLTMLLFDALSSGPGGAALIIEGWTFFAFGWLANLGTVAAAGGLTLMTVFVIAGMIINRKNAEGYT